VSEVEYLALGRERAKEVAALHFISLPDDYLPAFGEKVLQAYYAYSIPHKRAELFAACYGEQVVGVAQVVKGDSIFGGFFLRHPVMLFAGMLRILWCSPRMLAAILSTLRMDKGLRGECRNELAYVFVAPGFRRQGVATGLVQAVNQSLAGSGANCCVTKTLARNEHLLQLYRSLCQEVKVVGKFTDQIREYAYIQWTV
jgi:GNAT superfamily N-acetyltransferase